MKTKKLSLLGLLLITVGSVMATNTLKVQNVSLNPGEEVELSIELENETTNLMGWQCDIVLPEGLSLALKTNGKPKVTLGDRFSTTGHTTSSNHLANGAYRFIATSIDGETIPGSSGTLFTVTLQADASVPKGTSLTGYVKNIEFNTKDNQKLGIDDISFTIIIPNGDGKKCATPTISMENDKLKFSCETEGVTFYYTTIGLDKKSGNGSEMSLVSKYQVSVYAAKDGYDNSNTTTMDITVGGNNIKGDINNDGAVNVADHVALSNIIMEHP